MKSLLIAITLISTAAFAAPVKSGSTKKAAAPKLTRAQQKMMEGFGTSHKFTGSVVFGKLPSSGASTTTVENDKFLEDLIGTRKDFSDREKLDSERQ